LRGVAQATSYSCRRLDRVRDVFLHKVCVDGDRGGRSSSRRTDHRGAWIDGISRDPHPGGAGSTRGVHHTWSFETRFRSDSEFPLRRDSVLNAPMPEYHERFFTSQSSSNGRVFIIVVRAARHRDRD
jgi:hypothetical protein